MIQNDKKLCLLHFISWEAYMWLWFWVHKCKMMISPDAFFIFSKFWFSRSLGWEGGSKRAASGIIHHVIGFWYTCRMMIFLDEIVSETVHKDGDQWRKKLHTWEEGGAHLRISFWHLLMNLKNKYEKTVEVSQ